MSSRIARESKTVAVMITLYCRDHHPGGILCAECKNLTEYAVERLKHCPFQEGKTTCAKCQVHCYRSDMHARIREVMVYSGPRMILKHPSMAIYHMIDSRKKTPLKSSTQAKQVIIY
jgi:hypothetical protein